MSIESVRARLDAAKDGPWRLDEDKCCVYAPDGDMVLTEMGCSGRNHENAPLAAHAPADLMLALRIIDEAKEVAANQADDIDPRLDYVVVQIDRDNWDALRTHIEAFEALP